MKGARANQLNRIKNTLLAIVTFDKFYSKITNSVSWAERFPACVTLKQNGLRTMSRHALINPIMRAAILLDCLFFSTSIRIRGGYNSSGFSLQLMETPRLGNESIDEKNKNMTKNVHIFDRCLSHRDEICPRFE